MNNNWMYFGSSDPKEEEEDEILYDSLANKRDGDTKYEMIRCFACGIEEYAVLDEFGRFVCNACKAWEKKNLGGQE